MHKYQQKYPEHRLEEWRSIVGNYGIPKDYHLRPISHLSDGLKTRLVFCEISLQKPHLLLFDEPTNAADMEMIDSMSEAIKNFNGGVVVISHDFRYTSIHICGCIVICMYICMYVCIRVCIIIYV